MLHINRAARQEKEKSSQTPRLGMRSYTIDTIETYASATNDTPAPQISMLEERSMDFGCELFSGRTSPLVKKMFSCFEIPTLKSGVRGRKKFCGKREMKISCELFSTTSRSIHLSYNDTLQLARK